MTKENAMKNFLLKKAESLTETKYYIPEAVCPMTEGDVAICILLDMYKMNDEHKKVLNENTPGVERKDKRFWQYIHESEENRKIIIKTISDWIEYAGYSGDCHDVKDIWVKDEIINHRFELVSDDFEESFFIKEIGGIYVTSFTYVEKGKTETVSIYD